MPVNDFVAGSVPCDVLQNNAEVQKQQHLALQWLGTGFIRATRGDNTTSDYAVPRVPDFVLSGCQVSIGQAPNALTVTVQSGTFQFQELTRQIASLNTLFLSPGNVSNPRIDLLEVTTAGVVSVVQGTPAFVPTTPAPTSGRFALEAIYVPAGATAASTGINAPQLLEEAVSRPTQGLQLYNVVQVTQVSDFDGYTGAANIPLSAGTIYQIVGDVSVNGHTLVLPASGTDCFIEGKGGKLIKTDAGAIITGNGALSAENCAFEATGLASIFNVGPTTGSFGLDFFGLRDLTLTGNMGTVRRRGSVVIQACAFVAPTLVTSETPLTLDGPHYFPAIIDGCYVQGPALGASFIIPATYNNQQGLLFSSSVFFQGGTSAAMITVANVEDSFSVAGQGGFRVVGCAFRGPGPKISVDTSIGKDRFSYFASNDGAFEATDPPGDTVAHLFAYQTTNVTATEIVTAGVPVEMVTGPLTIGSQSLIQIVSTTLPRAQYLGSRPRRLRIDVNATLTAGNGQELTLSIYKSVGGVGAYTLVGGSAVIAETTGTGIVTNLRTSIINEARVNDIYTVYIANIDGVTDAVDLRVQLTISEI